MKKIIVSLFSTLFLGITFLVADTSAADLTLQEVESYKSKEEIILAKDMNILSAKELKIKSDIYKRQIQYLSNEEFDAFIHNAVSKTEDITALKKNLDLVGVELLTSGDDDKLGINTVIDLPSELNLSAYASKRTGDSFYRLQSSWAPNASEIYQGSLDVVSIEWNPNHASFYDAVPSPDKNNKGTNIVFKHDGSKASQGIYLFSVDDSRIFNSYATVYVKKKSGTSLLFGTKYIHTFTKVSVGGSFGISANFSSKGTGLGLTFGLTLNPKEFSIQAWEDNILYW